MPVTKYKSIITNWPIIPLEIGELQRDHRKTTIDKRVSRQIALLSYFGVFMLISAEITSVRDFLLDFTDGGFP